MAQCMVCGAANATCTHRGYVAPQPPDLLDERSQYVARQTATQVVRMPKQYVRPGRGEAGYVTEEGVKVETFETPEYRNMVASQSGSGGDSGGGGGRGSMTNAQRRERLSTLGVTDVPNRATAAELDKMIADAESGQGGQGGGGTVQTEGEGEGGTS